MIVGEKVVLEEIDPDNIEQLRKWRNDPNLRRWFREFKDITKDQQEIWYKTRGNNTNPSHVYFQIMSLGNGDNKEEQLQNRYLIGCCGLLFIKWEIIRSGELSIFLGEDRNQNKEREALTLLFNYGFKELNLNKIWGEIYKENPLTSLYGEFMKYEGEIRDTHFYDGEYHNSIVMSALQREWKKE